LETKLDTLQQSLSYRDSDSTLRGVYGIDSTYMKKAALYARVSGDLQVKEGTIESQMLALQKQIAAAGHVLSALGLTAPRSTRCART
jgi:hypothetical protein